MILDDLKAEWGDFVCSGNCDLERVRVEATSVLYACRVCTFTPSLPRCIGTTKKGEQCKSGGKYPAWKRNGLFCRHHIPPTPEDVFDRARQVVIETLGFDGAVRHSEAL